MYVKEEGSEGIDDKICTMLLVLEPARALATTLIELITVITGSFSKSLYYIRASKGAQATIRLCLYAP